MQVKKFEAPTIQEALETIKRELGPEAVILQTKKNKRGFGLLSKGSVEITAAVSDRSLQKKTYLEKRLPETSREQIKKLPADRQASIYDKHMDKVLEKAMKVQERIDFKNAPAAPSPAPIKNLTSTRYIDIEDDQPGKKPAKKLNLPYVQAPDLPIQNLNPDAKSDLAQEMNDLKRMIHELKSAQENALPTEGANISSATAGVLATPSLHDTFEQLLISGVDKRFALNLVRKTSFELGPEKAKNIENVLDQLALEVMDSIEVGSLMNQIKTEGGSPAVIAFTGPTGVGKTTSIAKIAAEAVIKQNLKVGLINLDTSKSAGFDQLATYAKILNLPFRCAANADELKAAVLDFQKLGLILIDTTGRSQRDPGSLQEAFALIQNLPNVRAELVLSVTTRDPELYDAISRFNIFKPQGLILSKLDEATSYGAILNVAQKSQLPIHYFATGQRVPEDLEEATRERVAALILDL